RTALPRRDRAVPARYRAACPGGRLRRRVRRLRILPPRGGLHRHRPGPREHRAGPKTPRMLRLHPKRAPGRRGTSPLRGREFRPFLLERGPAPRARFRPRAIRGAACAPAWGHVLGSRLPPGLVVLLAPTLGRGPNTAGRLARADPGRTP